MFTSGVLAILLGFMITARNREICKRIESTIDRGDKIVIWPSNIVEKDINDMVLGGHDVKKVVELNTYSKLQAKVKFTEWKKFRNPHHL
ncbi:MAG: hypothetical protein CM15mV2_2040 [uncultured marine virus]|nr:MAG: hypothetical protein CM15mV2_2040 [uncultured marine virus]